MMLYTARLWLAGRLLALVELILPEEVRAEREGLRRVRG
jgi:hypothetical protein